MNDLGPKDPPPLDPEHLDLEQIAHALQDQGGYEHHWLLDAATGEVIYYSDDLGPDEYQGVDLDAALPIDPIPSWVWYQDMADFVEGISDEEAARRLARAINGRGAFRRFKNELHEEYPELVEVWYAFRDARANQRAVDWLQEEGLVADDTAQALLQRHPLPELP